MVLRQVGQRIKAMITDGGRTIEDFCRNFHYSEEDIGKLCCGRLMFTPTQYRKLAEDLNTTVEDLFDASKFVSCGECMGRFSNEESEKQIWDLFEMYILLAEAAN